MSTQQVKLDFLVLGAQKAGTTSLHDMLSRHPDIALPLSKETHFFSHPDRAERGLSWYHDQFRPGAESKLTGEIDPEYLYSPAAPEAIRALTSARKFVVILRNPLDRAFSQYQMSLQRGYEDLAFDIALARETERLAGDQPEFAGDHWSYAARSHYANQIRRYREAFPDGEFLFLRSDSLSGSGYEHICNFLGSPPVCSTADAEVRSNSAHAPRSRLLRDLLFAPRGKSTLRRLGMKALPSSLKTRMFLWLDRLNRQPATLDRETAFARVPRNVLVQFCEDLKATESLTGLDLSDWQMEIRTRLERSAIAGGEVLLKAAMEADHPIPNAAPRQ